MASVFLSYRRNDTSGHAARLYKELSEFLGSNNVFFDAGKIDPGQHWDEVIRNNLQNVEVLVALIGKHWASDRLQQSNDYVRLEIATALQRNIKVVPVIFDGFELPNEQKLPVNMKALLSSQAHWVNHRSSDSYEHDLAAIVQTIGKYTTVTGTVQVKSMFQFTALAGLYGFYVDNKKIGTFRTGETKKYAVPVGHHTIFVNMFGLGVETARSRPIELYVTNPKTLHLNSWFVSHLGGKEMRLQIE